MVTPAGAPRPSRLRFRLPTSEEGQRRTKQAVATLFPGKTPHEIAAAAGAFDGAEIHLSGNGNVLQARVTVPHSDPEQPLLYASTRSFGLSPAADGTLRPHMHIHREDAHADIRGQGRGRKRFADSAAAAHAIGVHDISLIGGAEAGDSGAFVWPSYGFNGPLHEHQFDSLSPELQRKIDAAGPRTFHTLFSAGGAPEWSKQATTTSELHFNPDPTSEHFKRFSDENYTKPRRSADGRAPVAGEVQPVAGRGAGIPQGGQAGAAGTPQEATRSPSSVSGGNGHREATLKSNLDARLRRAGLRFRRERTRHLIAHPLVQGLRLEGVLRDLLADPDSPVLVRDLAEVALLGGSPNLVAALGEELGDLGHSLAEQYNWRAAAAGLDLDAAAEDEILLLAELLGSRETALARLRARVESEPEWSPALGQSLRRLNRHKSQINDRS